MACAPQVVIIGAGFGGIAAAIELRRHGFEDITILEKAPRPGGTWWYNGYPGCTCDVPSHLYSFSFAQRRDWSRLCSPQEEILHYLQDVARDHGVDRLVVPNTDVTGCAWDGEEHRWSIEAADGRRWPADAVIVATGQLHQPAIPQFDGSFSGHSFHSARWDHDYDLRGKRVAVIGTGASAVQFVPEVAAQASRLYVFQRTGNWLFPRKNRAYPGWLRAIFRYVPGIESLRRWGLFHYAESLTLMIRHPRSWGWIGWATGPRAHLGIAVSGFPSLFLMYGPNTNTSGGSIIFYEEVQAAYIRQALERVRDHAAAAIEVLPEVEAASDRETQARFAGTAWTQCNSWYRDETGRVVTNWPGYMREYARRAGTLDPSEYRLVPQPVIQPLAA